MRTSTPFTFGIPLIPASLAADWDLVQDLLGLTLASVLAQTDPDFRVVVAGHDLPSRLPDDPRVTFVRAGWPAGENRPDNLDSGRKKHAINDRVMADGGGLLMFMDADDWVDTRLVETARARIAPDHVGGLVAAGFATDLRTLRSVALPHPGVFDGEFHRVCGSSNVVNLRPGHPDPFRRDPYPVLHDHHLWLETAREHGAEPVRLPVAGTYLVNTSANHSETHGPFADWRRSFNRGIASAGFPLDAAVAARFGLDLPRIAAVSERLAGMGGDTGTPGLL